MTLFLDSHSYHIFHSYVERRYDHSFRGYFYAIETNIPMEFHEHDSSNSVRLCLIKKRMYKMEFLSPAWLLLVM